MEILELIPGSDQWLAARRKYRTASVAPAMMGASKKTSRDELIQLTATGTEKEFSDYVKEVLFPGGHAIEAAARPIAEKIFGEELYPATAIDDDGYLLASYDGLNMMETRSWECKMWNEAKAADVRDGRVPEEDRWQVIQQLLVGVKECLYMVTDGTEEKMVSVWVTLSNEDRNRLMSGWKQFDEDVASYQHIEIKPEPVAEAIKNLPALSIQLVGEVKNSNLVAYRETALAFIQAINTDLQTDEDFVNAEAMVKFCGNAETELESAKKMALAQTASIDDLFRTVDVLKEEMRQKRLTLDKLVKARKESIKIEIRQEGIDELIAHYDKLKERLGKPYMPNSDADFSGVMKNKRTIASLRSAVNDEVARCKIAANDIADRIQINLINLRDKAADYTFLFNDVAQIIMKDPEDLNNIISLRISEHKQAEEARLEAERQRIREEEEQRAQAEQERIRAEEQRQEEEAERLRLEVEAKQEEPVHEVVSDDKDEPAENDVMDAMKTPEALDLDKIEADIFDDLRYHDISINTSKKIAVILVGDGVRHITLTNKE